MTWTWSTIGGNRINFEIIRPEMFSVDDIACALSKQCRFNGHLRQFYSVAEHSIRVSLLVPAHLKRQALLHDATEAYLGDMIAPLKVMMPEYQAMEDRMAGVIGARFGVELVHLDPEVKLADLVIRATEKRDLRPGLSDDEELPPPLADSIVPMDSDLAKAQFLIRCREHGIF